MAARLHCMMALAEREDTDDECRVQYQNIHTRAYIRSYIQHTATVKTNNKSRRKEKGIQKNNNNKIKKVLCVCLLLLLP